MPLNLAYFVAAAVFTQVAGQTTRSPADYVSRGETEFLAGEVETAVKSFERAIELEPRAKPHLWQLGICYYYADAFEQGRKLFEAHQAVNRNDVENAAWHFLCVARRKDVMEARNRLLEIDTRRDTRVPMAEVYELYAGRGSPDAVLAAAEKDSSARALMYAHLYLGLYYEVSKQPDLARKHMEQSASAQLKNNYMHGVAKVHLRERNWTAAAQ